MDNIVKAIVNASLEKNNVSVSVDGKLELDYICDLFEAFIVQQGEGKFSGFRVVSVDGEPTAIFTADCIEFKFDANRDLDGLFLRELGKRAAAIRLYSTGGADAMMRVEFAFCFEPHKESGGELENE